MNHAPTATSFPIFFASFVLPFKPPWHGALAALVIAAAPAVATPARQPTAMESAAQNAQTPAVYRCGSSYSEQPSVCDKAVVKLDITDPRTRAQSAQARALAAENMRQARHFDAQREQEILMRQPIKIEGRPSLAQAGALKAEARCSRSQRRYTLSVPVECLNSEKLMAARVPKVPASRPSSP